MIRCNNCGEMYENTIDGLIEHKYGDNPYARYCSEITLNRIITQKFFNKSWLDYLFSLFKKDEKIKYNALNELLEYKNKIIK